MPQIDKVGDTEGHQDQRPAADKAIIVLDFLNSDSACDCCLSIIRCKRAYRNPEFEGKGHHKAKYGRQSQADYVNPDDSAAHVACWILNLLPDQIRKRGDV